jgi:hypothetical protein
VIAAFASALLSCCMCRPADKSLADWLMDASASKHYAADLQAGHRHLTQRLTQLVVKAPSGGSGLAAAYAQQYLAQHAAACGDMPALEQLVTAFGFLADVFRAGHGSKLVSDVAGLGLEGVPELVRDAQRWLLAEQAELSSRAGNDGAAKAFAWTVVQTSPQGSPLLLAARQEVYVKAAIAAGQEPWDCTRVLGGKEEWGALWTVLKVGGMCRASARAQIPGCVLCCLLCCCVCPSQCAHVSSCAACAASLTFRGTQGNVPLLRGALTAGSWSVRAVMAPFACGTRPVARAWRRWRWEEGPLGAACRAMHSAFVRNVSCYCRTDTV